jgi:hypothetical protein
MKTNLKTCISHMTDGTMSLPEYTLRAAKIESWGFHGSVIK